MGTYLHGIGALLITLLVGRTMADQISGLATAEFVATFFLALAGLALVRDGVARARRPRDAATRTTT